MKYVIFPQNIKKINLTYNQMLSNERAHQITIENMCFDIQFRFI